MSNNSEHERTPAPPHKLQTGRYFAASFAGEHIAGTEFVIGALFVSWGVSVSDLLWGLVWGNLLAVLTWALICAPIAVDTRMTLYAYLERVGGRRTVQVYSLINGLLFCILAGAMITVSASAVRILFDVGPQVSWYPTDFRFIAVAIFVGFIVVAIAVSGFKRLAQFAQICAPWLVMMFVCGALLAYPALETAAIKGSGNSVSFFTVAEQFIWRGINPDFGVLHVAAFAWICNLAMHGGLSDMSILRFAKRYEYGYFSAFGMFIGHFLAWICAGIMGAAAALLLGTSITALDAGAVAYEILGYAGIAAVIIAGWTTSNPTIYRAGLAFHSLHPSWSRTKVTAITGVITTVIACFPFVFTGLMAFIGVMGLVLAPVGAILIAEHWILPKLSMHRYWFYAKGVSSNLALLAAWALSLIVAFILHRAGLHLYFLLLPTWITATVLYLVFARLQGANQFSVHFEQQQQYETERKRAEKAFLSTKLRALKIIT